MTVLCFPVRLWSVDDLTNKAIYCGHNYPVLSLAMRQVPDKEALLVYFLKNAASIFDVDDMHFKMQLTQSMNGEWIA